MKTKYIDAGIKTFAEEVFEKDKYFTGVEYYHYKNGNKECLGEVDLMGYVEGTLVIVEYKLRNTKAGRKKARNQLINHKRYVVPTGEKYALVLAHGNLHFEVLEEGVKWPSTYSALLPKK